VMEVFNCVSEAKALTIGMRTFTLVSRFLFW
jgi:hypothetical protein